MESTGIYKRPASRYPQPTAAVFLDRDGVVVEEVGYLHRTQDVRLLDGVSLAIATLNQAALPTVLVTNQAGIGRGYYGWPEFETTQAAIEDQLRPGVLDGVWACAYHVDGVGELAREHPFRKPNPGMLLDAAATMNLHLAQSWMVGDKLIDLECAQRAGLAGAVLVRTGYGREMEAHLNTLAKTSCRTFVCDGLPEAVALILGEMAARQL